MSLDGDTGGGWGSPERTFGAPEPGFEYRDRRAAYGVIFDEVGRVLVVPGNRPIHLWLPGGGAEGDESPEETLLREIREELGHEATIEACLGGVLQFFGLRAKRWRMHAVFFSVELRGEASATAEYDPQWVDVKWGRELNRVEDDVFFHDSHRWAVAAARAGNTDNAEGPIRRSPR